MQEYVHFAHENIILWMDGLLKSSAGNFRAQAILMAIHVIRARATSKEQHMCYLYTMGVKTCSDAQNKMIWCCWPIHERQVHTQILMQSMGVMRAYEEWTNHWRRLRLLRTGQGRGAMTMSFVPRLESGPASALVNTKW
jgi:hypothetical protein